MKTRCEWSEGDPLYMEYHDTEWGLPLHDDRRLFEFLVLDGAQAGLSWLTILKKRENYRKAFHNFDPAKIAAYTSKDVNRLLADAGIVRNRLKIESAIKNARAMLTLVDECGSFDSYLWKFVDGRPVQNAWRSIEQIPAKTALSDTISKDMKKRGFNFVGSTIIYAFLQAAGIVNDHVVGCFRHAEVRRPAAG